MKDVPEMRGENMNLKKRREEMGYTQQELANLIKKERSLVAKIESGAALPSVATAKSISNFLFIDWTLFFKDVGE